MSHVADEMHAGSPASGLLVAIAVVADIATYRGWRLLRR